MYYLKRKLFGIYNIKQLCSTKKIMKLSLHFVHVAKLTKNGKRRITSYIIFESDGQPNLFQKYIYSRIKLFSSIIFVKKQNKKD